MLSQVAGDSLETLNFNQANINSEKAIALSTIFERNISFSHLRQFLFAKNQKLNVDSFHILLEKLGKRCAGTLEELNLENCNLNDAKAQGLVEMF